MRCAVGCGLLQHSGDSTPGVDTVQGDPDHPVSRGVACQRGIRETADPGGARLTRPLVRTDGDLVAVPWGTALEVAAEGLREALTESPGAVGVIGSGQQTTEAAYALGKLARGGFGTRNYDANTTLCMASAVTAYFDAFGSDAPPPTYDDIPVADSHIIWGANPAVAHPVMFRWIRESAADDGSLIVVDPVATETAEVADRHVALRPGSDLTLARAILARIVERGAVDEAFVAEATRGFDALSDRLPDAAAAAAAAGVDLGTVDAFVDAFERPTLLYWGMGVNQHVDGTATAGALIDLCLATGTMGPGSGPFSLTGQANSMGARVCSSTGSWPGHREFTDPTARTTVADAWGVPVDRLPDDPGPGPVGILESVGEGVKAIWTVATNPVAGAPDATSAADALDEAFLVVQDAFRSETVAHADVVLPAATWGEASGTAMNMERTVSRIRPVTDPPPGARSDLDIIAAIAEAVVPDLALFDGPPCDPQGQFRELADLTAGTAADCSGLSYPRLDAETAVRWPAPTADAAGGYRYYNGPADTAASSDPVDDEWSFPTPSGAARFSTVVDGRTAEPTDDAYPLTLTTARSADAYNTGVRTREGSPAPPVARLAPETLAATGLLDGPDSVLGGDGGEVVRIVSRRGDLRVRIEPDPAVPAGMVWLPIHHPRTNELTTPARDPRSYEPNFKQCAVRVQRGPPSDQSDGSTTDLP
jgi:assimilatory nitrate reductase catalytic subunit